MIMSTIDTVPGPEIAQTLGVVMANAMGDSKHVEYTTPDSAGMDYKEYDKISVLRRHRATAAHMEDIRAEAIERLTEFARSRGADAIVGMRSSAAFGSLYMLSDPYHFEVLAYGTAVELR